MRQVLDPKDATEKKASDIMHEETKDQDQAQAKEGEVVRDPVTGEKTVRLVSVVVMMCLLTGRP